MSSRAVREPQPIMIITRDDICTYPSITKAAEVTGIGRNRLSKALEREDGYILNSAPPVYVDLPIYVDAPIDQT